MTLWTRTAVMGLYTLSPTHVGTGQATGAIDLPIARDAATGFPVLPATSLKGVLRDRFSPDPQPSQTDRDLIIQLFGSELADIGKDSDAGKDSDGDDGGLKPGRLAVTEGRLVAYPVRSLSRPFFHVTCPQILEQLLRDLRATGGPAPSLDLTALDDLRGALASDKALAGKALVLEDLVFAPDTVLAPDGIGAIAAFLAGLLPADEAATRRRLESGLIVIPDADFIALMRSAVPVRARVKLTGGKTTDKWTNPDTGETESGNLWYEETLPSDCLFVALVGQRRDRNRNGATLQTLLDRAANLAVLQVGGHETVGQGLCLCTLTAAAPAGGAR